MYSVKIYASDYFTALHEPDSLEPKLLEIGVFVRHFNRAVFIVPDDNDYNKIIEGIPHVDKYYDAEKDKYLPVKVYFNKEENEYRLDACTEVSLSIPDLDLEYTGVAKCNLKVDGFNKLFGRKLAMQRALNLMHEDQIVTSSEERKKLWALVLPYVGNHRRKKQKRHAR